MIDYWAVGDGLKFGHEVTDVLTFGVELLPLEGWIEDAEIRSGIGARTRGPLPATIVAGELEVDQFFGEVGLAPPPIDKEMLAEEACDDHADAIVHPISSVQLAHSSIY